MDLIDNLITYLTNPNPTADEAQAAFEPLTNGDYSDIHIAALLATLKARGETAADITGAARAFLKAARPFPITGAGVLDTAGTGGDGANTINISTGASLIVAADPSAPAPAPPTSSKPSTFPSTSTLNEPSTKSKPPTSPSSSPPPTTRPSPTSCQFDAPSACPPSSIPSGPSSPRRDPPSKSWASPTPTWDKSSPKYSSN